MTCGDFLEGRVPEGTALVYVIAFFSNETAFQSEEIFTDTLDPPVQRKKKCLIILYSCGVLILEVANFLFWFVLNFEKELCKNWPSCKQKAGKIATFSGLPVIFYAVNKENRTGFFPLYF